MPLPLLAALAPPPDVELARITVAATGDVMLHGPVKRGAERLGRPGNHGGYDVPWGEVAGIVSTADLAFANLEFPVAPRAGAPGAVGVFNGPPAALDALASAGFDLVSVANNHALDQGRPGLVETVEHLDRAGLGWVGAGHRCADAVSARIVDLGSPSIRTAWIAATGVLNLPQRRRPADPCVAEIDEAAILEEVARARLRGVELVVVSLHWGTEYAPVPDPAQRAAAQALVDGGVDVILGHHPHVLQPIEWVRAADGRRALVAYSLGNFVSNQSAWYVPERFDPTDAAPRQGVVLRFTATRRVVGRGRAQTVRTEVVGASVAPLWTENGPARGIRVVPLEPLLDRLDRELLRCTDDERYERLDRERIELEAQWDAIVAAVGPGWTPER